MSGVEPRFSVKFLIIFILSSSFYKGILSLSRVFFLREGQSMVDVSESQGQELRVRLLFVCKLARFCDYLHQR